MKIAFLTEIKGSGKIPNEFPNMRTEFSWMHTLDAFHHNIELFDAIEGYDHVFIIFPKGRVFLSAEGITMGKGINPATKLLQSDIVTELKAKNNKVHFIQEGPHWWFNDYDVADQIHFYNMVSKCDSIFAHNEYDVMYYKGMFGDKPVHAIPTLMIETLISDIVPTKQEKVIIGGNFAHWYGGFESYIVAGGLGLPIWAQESHAKREYETDVPNLTHLPRLAWVDWMKALSEFKYAVHLMPTVAAGTFSLNCAYFAIPCIGNKLVDTQRICHPELSVDVSDLQTANKLLHRLQTDTKFYNECSEFAKERYHKYYSKESWTNYMNKKLEL